MKFFCLLAALVICAGFAQAQEQDRGKYLPYVEFIQRAQAGAIKSVTVDAHSGITGTMMEDGQQKPFRSFARTGSANDPLLQELLQQKGVPVQFAEEKEQSYMAIFLSMTGFMMFIVPIATLILSLVIYLRTRTILRKLEADDERE